MPPYLYKAPSYKTNIFGFVKLEKISQIVHYENISIKGIEYFGSPLYDKLWKFPLCKFVNSISPIYVAWCYNQNRIGYFLPYPTKGV